MKNLEKYLVDLLAEKNVNNIAIKIGKGDRVIYETYMSNDREINEETLFDMASVTKVLAPTSVALIALDKGLLKLDTKVSEFFPCGEDKKDLTIKHLLTHTGGIGWERLFEQEDVKKIDIPDFILNMQSNFAMDKRVAYSCLGYILLGKVLEKVYNKPLDILFNELVCQPLGMSKTGFCPKDTDNIINHNLTDDLLGIVNDRNSRCLGGVAGNAGVFSNIKDMTLYAKMMANNGKPILSSEMFNIASQNHTSNMSESRALGFLYVDERYQQTAGLFPAGSIGHCGHTGQSVFVDINTGLYVIILSDATISIIKKCGSDIYGRVMKMRADIHNAIKLDLAEGNL